MLCAEVSSFGFSGTNGHGLMEATLATEEPAQRAPMKFARKAQSVGGWVGGLAEWVGNGGKGGAVSVGQALNLWPIMF